mgnify:CR=1 FL=1
MTKILTVLGARPQFIKAASLSYEFTNRDVNEIIVHTGQHFDSNMSDIFFSELSIPKPKYNLGINSISHGAMVGRMLEKLENIMIKENPSYVVVYGDTNSTLAGSLAARKLGIKIAHVESGIRSFNNSMPEETNRILTDRLSDLLFCPSKAAIKNLESEGYHNFKEKQVIFSGDIMFDTLSLFIKKLKLTNDSLKAPYIMVTVHRAENTDDPEKLKSIFLALHEISKKYLIKLVLHPRTKLKLNEFKIQISKNIKVISPLSYVENISLLNNSMMLITDSGGMQKESYFLKKKCLTLRDDTEWTELIDLKCNILTGSNKEKIINSFNKLIDINPDFSSQIYGDANSRFIIANKILNN